MQRRICAPLLVLVVAFAACVQPRAAISAPGAPPTARVNGGFSLRELQEFTALEPVDTHVHDYKSNPVFVAMFRKLHLHVVDILVFAHRGPEDRGLIESREREDAWKVVRGSHGYAVLCTGFDPFQFNRRDFVTTTIRRMNEDFAQGAVALKIWKNIGMEILDAKGDYLLPDNPVFEPIYRDVAAHNRTLIAHVADPDEAWQPLDPTSLSYEYYSNNPTWYVYNKPHPPSKERILRARDHILEENPNLRLVGAHLGSMENDFPQLARHLDRYPNFAVDLAARLRYVMTLPRADAIAFLTKYQDRIIYATDDELFPADDIQKTAAVWEAGYARDWRALATGDTVVYNGRKMTGLALPRPILRKIYHDNALRWFPGIQEAQ